MAVIRTSDVRPSVFPRGSPKKFCTIFFVPHSKHSPAILSPLDFSAVTQNLVSRNIDNLLQSYADEGHLLLGVLEHVYRSMEDYLKECLSLDEDEQS